MPTIRNVYSFGKCWPRLASMIMSGAISISLMSLKHRSTSSTKMKALAKDDLI